MKRQIIRTLIGADRIDLANAVARSLAIAGRNLDRKTREAVNLDLDKAGLGGRGRYRKVGEALNVIAKVLSRHDIQQDDSFDANLFRDDKGYRTFGIAFSNPDDPFSPEFIGNSMLVVSWTLLRPGSYEVVSYLS